MRIMSSTFMRSYPRVRESVFTILTHGSAAVQGLRSCGPAGADVRVTPMSGALDGVRILDLSWGIAGAARRAAARRAGRRRRSRSSRPAATRSATTTATRSGTGPGARSPSTSSTQAGREAFLRLVDDADVLVETFRPGVTDRLGIGYDALHAAQPAARLPLVPRVPRRATAWRSSPGTTRSSRRAAGSSGSSPAGGSGPIFLHMPMPSMGAMFLVPTGILAALIAREETGRGQHVRTSLFQGALLYTTQIWTWTSSAPGDFFDHDGEDVPAGRAPADDLRGRGRRVGAHVGDERADAGEDARTRSSASTDPSDPRRT